MILAVETSDILCSVAFWSGGRRLVECNHELPMQHATLVGELVEHGLAFLSDKMRKERYTIEDLKAVAVAVGPGSFTGLRIGLGYVQGFCFGRDLPVVGISNHQVLAWQKIISDRPVCSLIEARRNEVYLAEIDTLDTGYPKIKKHTIVHKDDLRNQIPEGSQLICKKDMELPVSVHEELQKRNIFVHKGGIYSAGILAEVASLKQEEIGYDTLDDLEPMYIRPFAGMQ